MQARSHRRGPLVADNQMGRELFEGGESMSDELTFGQEILRGLLASGVVTAGGWGAAGGMTSALAVKVSPRAALRQIAMGALVAGGTGTFATALVSHWLGLSPELIPAVGAGASGSYFVGVFGPAIIEVMLRRIGWGRLPGEDGGDDGKGI